MKHWSAHVEWIDPDLTETQLDQLHEQLRHAHASVGGPSAGGRVHATLTVLAGTLRQAVAAALAAVEQAGRDIGAAVRPVEVEVLEEPERDRRLAEPLIPELVGTREVAAVLGVTQQRASQLAHRAGFPPPVAELAAGPVWTRRSIEAFNQRWDRRPGRPPGRSHVRSYRLDEAPAP